MIIHTATGSIYELNEAAKTWARVHKTSESGFIRGEGKGTYNDLSGLEVGQRLMLITDPITPGTTGRVLITSEICFIDHSEK